MENDKLAVPRHIAVIMDGNGRWAKQRGLPRVEGHIAGAERVREVLRYAREFGVEYMTLYAFSTENWKRSREEVDALMDLLSRFIDGYLDEMKQNNVRLLVTGRIDGLPERAANDLKRAMAETASLTGHTEAGQRSQMLQKRSRKRFVMDGLIPSKLTNSCFPDICICRMCRIRT